MTLAFTVILMQLVAKESTGAWKHMLCILSTFSRPTCLIDFEASMPMVESRSIKERALPAASKTAFVLPLENSESNTLWVTLSTRRF